MSRNSTGLDLNVEDPDIQVHRAQLGLRWRFASRRMYPLRGADTSNVAAIVDAISKLARGVSKKLESTREGPILNLDVRDTDLLFFDVVCEDSWVSSLADFNSVLTSPSE